MSNQMIKNYHDFVTVLLDAGFSMGGGNSEGIFSLITWSWNEQQPYDSPVRWHTADPETDPWEWRMRVLNERDDIAYAKFFFKKSGYITRAWFPYFLAARRGRASLEEDYQNGLISNYAKRIYTVAAAHEALPLPAIKQLAGFKKEDKSQFDRALVELQMKMYLTMCGSKRKISAGGGEYGWSSTVFCTTERFWGEELFKKAAEISPEDAILAITKQIHLLNPAAAPKKIQRFIKG